MNERDLIKGVFDKKHDYEAAVLCTYTLQLHFLDNYLLHLDGLDACDQITIFTDYSTYAGFAEEETRLLNQRYLIVPMHCAGVFHPKLYIFASEKKATIGLGSANLTQSGLTANLETIFTCEISQKNRQYAHLLKECLDYVEMLAQQSGSKTAQAQIEELQRICQTLLGPKPENDLRFWHNLNQKLLPKLVTYVKSASTTVHLIQIISPYYDQKLKPLTQLKSDFPQAEIEIYVQQYESSFPVDISVAELHPAKLFVYEGIERFMHGKMFLFHTDEQLFLFMGSANFTDAALLKSVKVGGNYEIILGGSINPDILPELLKPHDQQAHHFPEISLLKVAEKEENEREELPDKEILCLVEALLEDKFLHLTLYPSVIVKSFVPQQLLFKQNQAVVYQESISIKHDTQIIRTPFPSKLSGGIAVQLAGHDKNGDACHSNIVWIVALQERERDQIKKKIRRVYRDPTELVNVLWEFLEEGQMNDLVRFVQYFDIPSEVNSIPRRRSRGYRPTKGNVAGSLGHYRERAFDESMCKIYEDCLNRMFKKLKKHCDSPDVRTLANFTHLFTAVISLIEFIAKYIEAELTQKPIIKQSTVWRDIRNLFELMFRYLEDLWQMTWSLRGYYSLITPLLLSRDFDDSDDDPVSFWVYLLRHFNDDIAIFKSAMIYPIEVLEMVLEQGCFYNSNGESKPLNLFKHHSLYPESRNSLRQEVKGIAQTYNN